MLTSVQLMLIGAGIAVAVAGASVVGYGMYKKSVEQRPLTPWIGRHLSDIVIEDEDVHRLRDISIDDDPRFNAFGAGPRPLSACKRGECASATGRSTFGY